MFPGKLLSGAEIGAEIPVQELHAVLRRRPLGHLPHQLVLLVGADEQGGRKAVEAALGGLTGSLKQAHFVAFDAPPRNVLHHRPDKGAQTVIVADDQG